MPEQFDIVYILKEDINPNELRYSLRSVAENFPHRFVWFVGGQPAGFKPDRAIIHKQTGANKWERIRSSLLRVVKEPELSESFFLFNDDFFIMQPQGEGFINFIDKTLQWRVDDLRKTFPYLNHYGRTLEKANAELKQRKATTLNFEVHMPFLMEKSKALTILQCSSPQMRSIYGNLNAVPYVQHDDVKVYDLEQVPEQSDYLSTSEVIFENGKVGEYIRSRFPFPSCFEVET